MNIFINDRSNLDEVVCIIPRGHVDNKTDRAVSVTRREDLKRRPFIFRKDIVFVRTPRGGQFFLEACENGGVTGHLWLLEILTPEQYDEVFRIAHRMARNVDECPDALKLLSKERGFLGNE